MNSRVSILLLLLIIISFPLLSRYLYVNINQYEQIPLILRHLHPEYLVRDWSLTVNSTFSPRSFFIIYISAWSNFISLPYTYFLNYVLSIAGIAFATFWLTRRLFKSDISALLTTVTVLFGQSFVLGGNDLVNRDFHPHRIAYSLALVGIIAILENRYIISSLFFAMALYMHPLIGLEVPFAIYSAEFIISITTKQTKVNMKNIFISVLWYLAFSSVGLYTYLSSYFSQKKPIISDPDLITLIARVKAPYHYLPSSWPLTEYIYFIVFFIIFLIIFRRIFSSLDKVYRNILLLLILEITVICLTGYLFTEIHPVLFIAMAQVYRLSVLMYWIMAVVIYGFCFSRSQNKNKIALFILPFIPFIVSTVDFLKQPGFTRILFLIVGGIAVICLVYFRKEKTKVLYLPVIISVIAFAVLYRHYNFHFSETYNYRLPETGIEEWIKNNTPVDALFLVPPDFSGFRLNANRAIIADLLVVPYEYSDIYDYMIRLGDISGYSGREIYSINENKIIDGYRNISEERLKMLYGKYHFDYYVISSSIATDKNPVYSENGYSVYKM